MTAALLHKIRAWIKRYTVLPDEAAEVAVALWVAHTHVFVDVARCTPYLLVLSAEPECGKSTLIKSTKLLVREPLYATDISPAAMYRTIEKVCPTLMLDEIEDTMSSRGEEKKALTSILNAGYEHGATIPRCHGKHHEVKQFRVFCPKLFAGIESGVKLKPALVSRCILITMKRRLGSEPIERFHLRDAEPLADELRADIEQWAVSHREALATARPAFPESLSDRTCDVWEPLFAIADLAGGPWPELARQAAKSLSGRRDEQPGHGSVVLTKLRRLLVSGEGAVPSSDVAEGINEDEDLPYGGWNDSKGISPRWVAVQLKPYGITPDQWRGDNGVIRGYRLDDTMRDAFARYLPSMNGDGPEWAGPDERPPLGEEPLFERIEEPAAEDQAAYEESAGEAELSWKELGI